MGSHELSITNRITADAAGNGIGTMEHGTTILRYTIKPRSSEHSSRVQVRVGNAFNEAVRTSSVKYQATTLQELKAVQNRFERQMENNERKVVMEVMTGISHRAAQRGEQTRGVPCCD